MSPTGGEPPQAMSTVVGTRVWSGCFCPLWWGRGFGAGAFVYCGGDEGLERVFFVHCGGDGLVGYILYGCFKMRIRLDGDRMMNCNKIVI